MSDVWAIIAAERGALASDLADLTPAQWDTPSLCTGWTGADVRRPLGIPHTHPLGAVRQVIDFYKGSNMLIGSKNRIAGLALYATDHDWQHGQDDPSASRGPTAVAAARHDRPPGRMRRSHRPRRGNAPQPMHPDAIETW